MSGSATIPDTHYDIPAALLAIITETARQSQYPRVALRVLRIIFYELNYPELPPGFGLHTNMSVLGADDMDFGEILIELGHEFGFPDPTDTEVAKYCQERSAQGCINLVVAICPIAAEGKIP